MYEKKSNITRNNIKDCSKCAYESMILQEFISADKNYLENRNEEISDKLLSDIIDQTKVVARECGINLDELRQVDPLIAKIRNYIDTQEFDKASNLIVNVELGIRSVLRYHTEH